MRQRTKNAPMKSQLSHPRVPGHYRSQTDYRGWMKPRRPAKMPSGLGDAKPMLNGRPMDDRLASAQPEESGWSFAAVGLDGGIRTVRVEQLRGAVRLLTPADSAPSVGLGGTGLPPLPYAFIWNRYRRTFEPIESDTPD